MCTVTFWTHTHTNKCTEILTFHVEKKTAPMNIKNYKCFFGLSLTLWLLKFRELRFLYEVCDLNLHVLIAIIWFDQVLENLFTFSSSSSSSAQWFHEFFSQLFFCLFFVPLQIFHPKCKNKPTILHHTGNTSSNNCNSTYPLQSENKIWIYHLKWEKRVARIYDVLVDVRFEPHIYQTSIPLLTRESCNCYWKQQIVSCS